MMKGGPSEVVSRDYAICLLDRVDAPAITSLLNSVFRTPVSVDEWLWYAEGSPMGAGRTYGARDSDGRVIACYGVVPVRLSLGGATVAAGYGHHLAVHADVRSAALFVELSRAVMVGEAGHGLHFILGAANSRAYPLHRRLAGWRDAGALDVAFLARPTARPTATPLEPIEFDDAALDVVRCVTGQSAWHFERSAPWLRWRYLERPGVRYEPLGLFSADRLDAWGVLKRFQDPQGPSRGHVMELWAREARLAADWLESAVTRLVDVDEVTAWVSPTSRLHEAYARAGFAFDAARRQPLIVRSLGDWPAPGEPGLMSLGDADGF